MDKQALRQIILHEYKLGHNVVETTANINKAWGDGTITRQTVKLRFNRFDSGDFDLTDKVGRGRKSVVDMPRLRRLVMSNPHLSTKQYAAKLNVGASSIKRAFKKHKLVKKA